MRIIHIILPGLLVAATGVGAGDLATASIVGSLLGVSVLWAVIAGGVMKYFLTEGIGRWQLASQQSLLAGIKHHFGRFIGLCFLPYLLLWSFFVGAALISACGVTLNALLPLFSDPTQGKIILGIFCSISGLLMLKIGGFALFEKVMGICIAAMFITVVTTAIILWPSTSQVLSGAFLPRFEAIHWQHFNWIVALIGGVGGTVTMLCYGYWIREKGRTGTDSIAICRIDLAVGYSATILFGIAMVIIASHIEISGSGADLLVKLAQQLEDTLGLWGRWIFLIGAFGAVFSSLLGVWQAVPLIFSETWQLFIKPVTKKDNSAAVPANSNAANNLSQTREYFYFQIALATIPMLGLWVSFKNAQQFYALTGALFIPLMALALLVLNNYKIKKPFSNSWLNNIALCITLIFFAYMAAAKYIKL